MTEKRLKGERVLSIVAPGGLDGKHAMVSQSPQSLDELRKAGARYVARDVPIDGNMVTAEGPAAARELGRKPAELPAH